MVDFHEFIKNTRKLSGKTLREIEHITGISNSYLSQLENGKIKNPSPIKIYKISQALEINYEKLMRMLGYPLTQQNDDVKGRKLKTRNKARISTSNALKDITPEEEVELLRYLGFIRSK